jgi:hypothetical protein
VPFRVELIYKTLSKLQPHAGTERLLAENGNFGMATGQITLMRQACD